MSRSEIETDHEKPLAFFYFPVKEEMYEALKSLTWIEVGGGRDTGPVSSESLSVVGKSYKVAYKCIDGTFQVREAFRFLAEGLATLKLVSENGGQLVHLREDDE